MKRKLEDGVALLKESYSYLGKEIEKLRDEAIEIENEVIKVGNTMSSKMNTLQTKAEDIGNMAGVSLEKQQELLDGQSTALKGLNSLNEVQFKALEESRKSVQYFSEYGHKQQEELLQRQEQMQGLHDRLMENSKTVLSAQETFEAKQATMFVALDKIFALQNAMLLESRVIKAFFIYAISIFVIFMLTSTKQTYNVRPLLYIELCVALFVEVFIIRLTNDDIEQQTWIINKVRLFLMVAASAQLTYAIVTYRDYERLNHQMLLTLLNKINNMEKLKDSNWDFDTTDYVDWSQLIASFPAVEARKEKQSLEFGDPLRVKMSDDETEFPDSTDSSGSTDELIEKLEDELDDDGADNSSSDEEAESQDSRCD
ncbi:protein GAMETE EXPRESSED 1 [Medicago truncatula]|uniref:protein GAMETE EXPRESSED 1 n=1 Tax=Medicago truncatula TaxID=3880 RepID=UPI001967F5BE|nr:protein GAMETE EXPRESSED 1-like [Medicago truncatula]